MGHVLCWSGATGSRGDLAVSSTEAPGLCSTPARTRCHDRAMPVTQGFNHIATMTADLDRLIKFYADAFGGEVTFEITKTDDHPRMVNIELGGGAGLNVFEVPTES